MMKRLVQLVGKAIGFRFAPDNHVVPVLRLAQYHRLQNAGYFWVNPFLAETLAPISIGLRVADFKFNEVLSQDNIPFTINLTVLYQFDPHLPPRKTLAQLVRLPADTLQDIVKNYASQGLRRLASDYQAEALTGSSAMTHIECDLTHYLRAQLRILGLVPLRKGGVLIKETTPPEKFKLAMLAAKQHQLTLQVLGDHYEGELIEQAIRAQFLTGIEAHEGNVTLLSSLDGTALFPPYAVDNPKRPSPRHSPHNLRDTNGPTRPRGKLTG
jgi:regulator of protease activity HflC (stomatin/prohibitin superfamily)